jgi:hypothetical protein
LAARRAARNFVLLVVPIADHEGAVSSNARNPKTSLSSGCERAAETSLSEGQGTGHACPPSLLRWPDFPKMARFKEWPS